MKNRSWSTVGIAAAVTVGFVAIAGPTLTGRCCLGGGAGATAMAAETAPATASKTATLKVGGMTCAACSLTVRIALKKLDGVKSATVDVSAGRASVEYDPTKVKPEQMAEAVTKAGYDASVLSPG